MCGSQNGAIAQKGLPRFIEISPSQEPLLVEDPPSTPNNRAEPGTTLGRGVCNTGVDTPAGRVESRLNFKFLQSTSLKNFCLWDTLSRSRSFDLPSFPLWLTKKPLFPDPCSNLYLQQNIPLNDCLWKGYKYVNLKTEPLPSMTRSRYANFLPSARSIGVHREIQTLLHLSETDLKSLN